WRNARSFARGTVRISARGPVRHSRLQRTNLYEPFVCVRKTGASWWRTLFETPDADAPWNGTVEGPANSRLRSTVESARACRSRGHGAAVDGVAARACGPADERCPAGRSDG